MANVNALLSGETNTKPTIEEASRKYSFNIEILERPLTGRYPFTKSVNENIDRAYPIALDTDFREFKHVIDRKSNRLNNIFTEYRLLISSLDEISKHEVIYTIIYAILIQNGYSNEVDDINNELTAKLNTLDDDPELRNVTMVFKIREDSVTMIITIWDDFDVIMG